uniref:Uncharacterized protein n=1 Tax=Microcystis aeruginosa (strain PCC 7806) TaxID=267872 RepID=A8Y9W4_MICA7|nr:unnamed protein product [Microcystis aeruginosa PCC 7806]CAO91454.1 unnamed protein product [Microcystis aeruginosa PCC 7806]
MYRFQLLLGVGTLIEFYFKLIICITIPEEPKTFTTSSKVSQFPFLMNSTNLFLSEYLTPPIPFTRPPLLCPLTFFCFFSPCFSSHDS